MPWKGEKDPYKIWISEIILQQTRVQQGLGYYQRFISAFPDIKSLATAPEQQVYKLWEGLGYYSRCKNLIATARYIYNELEGIFPKEYESILALKGIGVYTASAISSFAYGLPHAVVDGNVFRVLSRYFGVTTPINTTEGKKRYSELAQQLLYKKDSAQYNQAIMDFGAVICKPLSPLCSKCPLQKRCVAFLTNKVSQLPINGKKINLRTRCFNYLVIEHKKKYLVRKRIGKDIWQNLFEFVLIETDTFLEKDELVKNETLLQFKNGHKWKVSFISKRISQKLTHQILNGQFVHIDSAEEFQPPSGYKWVTKKQIKLLP
ncbi:MAG: A/G-specific adenine glycosylase, partial [Ginsengibacter sp.]